jgi:uncharacterized Zn-binding protein involved in type VI secretion
MFPVAVSGISMGTCTCAKHSNPETPIWEFFVVTGSMTYQAGAMPVARVGDMVVSACGCTGHIITGSSNISADNLPVARVESMVIGYDGGSVTIEGMITTGITTVVGGT